MVFLFFEIQERIQLHHRQLLGIQRSSSENSPVCFLGSEHRMCPFLLYARYDIYMGNQHNRLFFSPRCMNCCKKVWSMQVFCNPLRFYSVFLQNMFQSFFVTAEKPHLGFYFTVAAGCTNMVLDVLMVGVWGWGVEGAAIATFLSQIVGGLLPIFYFLDHKNTSRLHLRKTQLYSKVLLDACINGSSELMTNLSMSLVNILYNYQLLRLAGENGVAAYGVIMYACFLFIAVYVGYAFGSAPIVSFHYGAGNRAEVHNLYEKSLRLIAVVAVTLTAASMVIIPYVARFFVGYDPELLALTSRAFRLYALSFVIMGFNVYASSFFTALGDGVTSALISFLRTLVFQIAAVLILPAILGIDGIWLAVTAAELAALAVSAAMFVTKDKVFHYRKA